MKQQYWERACYKSEAGDGIKCESTVASNSDTVQHCQCQHDPQITAALNDEHPLHHRH